jgi:hypothetical protein
MASHSVMKTHSILSIFLIKRCIIWHKTSLVSLSCGGCKSSADTPWTNHLHPTPLSGLAGLDPEIYTWIWSPRAAYTIQTSSDRHSQGSQRQNLSKIRSPKYQNSAQCSVHISAGEYLNIDRHIYLHIYQ